MLPFDAIVLLSRRETRPAMAEHGVIRWLARQLSQIDTMPLSSLECCGALLMNLAMAKAGRHECQQVTTTALRVLLALNTVQTSVTILHALPAQIMSSTVTGSALRHVMKPPSCMCRLSC